MQTIASWGWPAIWLGASALVALAILALGIGMVLRRAAPVVHSGKQRTFRLDEWKPDTMRPLTQRELHFLLHLRRALPECLLLPQIALARFLNVSQNKSYNQWFGSVGRRCVDFLVCSEQGDVLGVIQLQGNKGRAAAAPSEGTQRKLKSLEIARIPVWHIATDPLPDAQTLRTMVMPELQAAQEHSHMLSVQQAESEWQHTQLEPRRPPSAFANAAKSIAPASAKPPPKPDRWDQDWPTEEARSSEFLDEMGMIELPPLVVKGSGRSATGFTRG